MTEWLGLPALASAHGGQIDSLIGWIHVFMFVLFIGWGGFFLYCLIRFRRARNPVADYTGVTSPASKYSEIAVAIVEAILLVGFAIPLWAARVDSLPSPSRALVVQVTGEQFAWNVHYPGPDGVFCPRASSCSISSRTRWDSIATILPRKTTSRCSISCSCRSTGLSSSGSEQGRHSQLRRAGVARETGRDPGPHNPHPFRPHRDDAEMRTQREMPVPVPDCLRAALRFGSCPDARIRDRPDR